MQRRASNILEPPAKMRTLRGFIVVWALSGLTLMMPSTAVQAQKASPAESKVRTACRNDYMRFCMGVMPGGGRIEACLTANTASLAPPCRSALAHLKSSKSGASR
jgi:hypothetical protein